MTDQTPAPTSSSLGAALEALLFVASNPVTPAQLAAVLNITTAEVDQELQRMQESYQEGRGLALQWHGGRVQMTTAPELAGVVENFLGLEATSRLSRAAMETLTIVAYRQPITRPGIDAIRGVSSDGVLKNLLSKGLVFEVGRTEGPGRPILYGTTEEFLQHFGLSSLTQLPPFELMETDLEESKNGILKD